MTCTDVICGTGGFTGPKPGDPDNNVALSATPDFGGINLTWTYPLVNPYAVSHVNIFRGISNNPALAVLRDTRAGTSYFDKIPANEIREYFYWIQFVSTNGTYLDWIGPVSATPKSSAEGLINDLSGQIDESVLAQALRDKFGEVTILKTSLDAEINARLTSGAAIASALAAVQSETAQAITLITSEVTQRATAEEALVDTINVVAVGMGDNAAAIANESLARANDMSAVALQMSTVEATLNDQIVGVQTTMGAAIQTLDNKATNLGALYTVKLTAGGLAGGFGVYNDGTSVEAGFDVDTFWVGKLTNKVKPFIIQGDTVYIDKARIRSGDIDTLKIAGNAVTVPVYAAVGTLVPGNNGWQQIISASITNTSSDPMQVLCMFTGTLGFNSGSRLWGFKIFVDGVFTGYALEGLSDVTALPAFNYHHWVAANSTATFSIQFFGADSSLIASFRTLTLLGTKR